ncbi:MAG: choice-of-anchor Q domain-containing protein [Planctomycetaceae bacterium]
MFRCRTIRRAPVLEVLEERCLLSTITVTSLVDNTTADGEVTLREAILAANSDTSVDGSTAGSGPDKIVFAPAITSGTIVLSDGPLEITESLVVRGPANKVTVDAAQTGRILDVSSDANSVVLNQLRFRNARNTAIASESPKLKLLRSDFFDNHGDNGGAIHSQGGLILNQARFLRSKATNGGAAFILGSATIKDSAFISNRATDSGGAVNIEAETTIESSTFEDNEASIGGAIRFDASQGGLELADSLITENKALRASAIWSTDSRSHAMQIDSTTIAYNEITFGYDTTIQIQGFGHDSSDDIIFSEITGSTIANNVGKGVQVSGSKSGLAVVGSTVFENSLARISHIDELRIEDSTISGNLRGVSGSAISNAVILNSVISDNFEQGVYADRLGMRDSTVANNGRGVGGDDVTIWNSTITGNLEAPVYGWDLVLNHVTVAHNDLEPGEPAVEVRDHYGADAWIGNSIIASNHRREGAQPDLSFDDGELTLTHSLIGSNDGLDIDEARPGSPDADGNLIGTPGDPIDPLLGIAYDNGGHTLTMASSHNSPGINGAGSGLEIDQTGRPRVAAPDMGAFEFDASLHRDPIFVVGDAIAEESAEELQFSVMATSLPAPGNEAVATIEVQGGTARRSVDYPEFNALSVMLSPTSSTTTYVSVPLSADDALGEPDRTLNLVVSDIDGPNGGSESGTGTILNDDEFEVRVTTTPVLEGDGDGQVARFELEVVSGQLEPISVAASTSDLSAKVSEGDYEATDETIDFEGSTGEIQILEVPINGDFDTEFTERFAVSFSWPFTELDTVGEIINDDAGVIVQGEILQVVGTPGSEVIGIVQSESQLVVTVDGTDHSFLSNDVSQFLIQTAEGDDEVQTNTNISSIIEAGGGDDLVRVLGNARDTVLGEAGHDTLYAGAGRDKVAGGPGHDLAHGDAGPDTVFGGGDNDRLYGDGGDDEVYGNGGLDTVFGSIGNDTLIGGRQQDSLNGGRGHDSVEGGHASDQLVGGDNNDTLWGGDGHDTINGGNGRDEIHGGERDDVLTGGNGADTIEGDSGVDTILGLAGNDNLYGGSERSTGYSDRIEGGAGDDLITGFGYALGGGGNDIMLRPVGIFSGFADGGAGDDSIVGSSKIETLVGGAGNDTLEGGEGRDLLQGGAGNDFLGGDAGDDTLQGGSGNDILIGGDGLDVLNASTGNDLLAGGLGDHDATVLVPLWNSDRTYPQRVAAIESHLDETNAIHKFDDEDVDQLNVSGGRNYYLARTGLDVFSVEENENLFELLDQ